jgi:hypothetical protein
MMLMLGMGIGRNEGWRGGGTSSVCVDMETIAGAFGLGVGGVSCNGVLGVLGGLNGSSAVWHEPLTIRLWMPGILTRSG